MEKLVLLPAPRTVVPQRGNFSCDAARTVIQLAENDNGREHLSGLGNALLDCRIFG